MNFTQSSIFSIFASIGLLFINVFISAIESRVLGPDEIGRFQVFITTQSMFSTFCALGIGQACIYYINRLKKDEVEVLSSSVKFIIPISLLATLVLFVFLLAFKGYFGDERLDYLIYFSLGTNAMLLSSIFTPVLLTKMEVVKNQIVKYFTRVLTLVVLLIYLFSSFELTVGFLIALTGITNILTCLLLYYYLKDRIKWRLKINYPLMVDIIKWGVKLSGNNIASLILVSIPIYFITWMADDHAFADVGYYSRANALLVVGTVISSSIGPLLYAKWSGTDQEQLKSQVRRFSILFAFSNLCIAGGLILFAPLVIHIIYGSEFAPAIPLLRVLSLMLIANGVKEICYGILSSQGHPLKILKNLVIGIAISAVAYYLLIPFIGVLGCSIATVFVSFVTAVLLIIDVCKISIIRFDDFFAIPTKEDIINIINSITRKK